MSKAYLTRPAIASYKRPAYVTLAHEQAVRIRDYYHQQKYYEQPWPEPLRLGSLAAKINAVARFLSVRMATGDAIYNRAFKITGGLSLPHEARYAGDIAQKMIAAHTWLLQREHRGSWLLYVTAGHLQKGQVLITPEKTDRAGYHVDYDTKTRNNIKGSGLFPGAITYGISNCYSTEFPKRKPFDDGSLLAWASRHRSPAVPEPCFRVNIAMTPVSFG